MEQISTKWQRLVLLLLPLALCTVVYWHGLNCWFIQDDFAWLGLKDEWKTFPDLLRTLFQPMAQGTIRPISERAYFIVFRELFDLNAFPYHLIVFLTQFANLILLNTIAARLTNSSMAGFVAATLWCLNSVLAGPMSWTSSYNQILCSFVILLAFYFFYQYTVTGSRKYYVWQWIIFLVGFGVLEENVVYPALAVAYSMLFARKYAVSALCMFPASILYAIVHNAYSKGAHQGIYAVEFGPQTITTLLKYWTYSVWPSKLDAFVVYDPHVATFMIGAFSLAILSFLVLRNWKEPAALFGMAWFLIAIEPYLLLPNRISAYYPVVPTIGLSLLAASAIEWAWGKSVVI